MWPADQRSRERQWRRRSARLMVKQTKEGLDVLETNQPHPRPLLTFYRSSWTNLYLYQLCHLNEEHPTHNYLIQGGGVILYAYHTYD